MILWLLGIWPTTNLVMAGFSAFFVLLGLIPLMFAMEDGVSRQYRREGVEEAYFFFAVGAAFLVFGVIASACLAAFVVYGIGNALWRSIPVLRGRA